MKKYLKQYAGVMTREEFEDNLAVYRGMKDKTGYVFAEFCSATGHVYVYYHDLTFIDRFPESSLLASQSYVEISQ